MPGDDSSFMGLALDEARLAGREGEVPVGALVVRSGESSEILGRGHNLVISRSDPTAHAEIVALRHAARTVANYRLPGTTLYVTLEPCLLCLGAIAHARVSRVVYGAADPKRGALSVARSREVAMLLHHSFSVTGGVREQEAGELLREFFGERR